MAHMERWMREHGVNEVWVLADNPGAVEFYRACGLGVEDEQPVYMTRALDASRGLNGLARRAIERTALLLGIQ